MGCGCGPRISSTDEVSSSGVGALPDSESGLRLISSSSLGMIWPGDCGRLTNSLPLGIVRSSEKVSLLEYEPVSYSGRGRFLRLPHLIRSAFSSGGMSLQNLKPGYEGGLGMDTGGLDDEEASGFISGCGFTGMAAGESECGTGAFSGKFLWRHGHLQRVKNRKEV